MQKIPVFKKADGHTYRIIGKWRWVWERGYAEPSQEKFNVLQVKVWYGWKGLEEESVPSFAWISAACLGYSDWKSKLIEKHMAEAIR
jgi:hypothetical protein